jgi:hypothetical protein
MRWLAGDFWDSSNFNVIYINIDLSFLVIKDIFIAVIIHIKLEFLLDV